MSLERLADSITAAETEANEAARDIRRSVLVMRGWLNTIADRRRRDAMSYSDMLEVLGEVRAEAQILEDCWARYRDAVDMLGAFQSEWERTVLA